MVGKTAIGVPAPVQAASTQTINKKIREMKQEDQGDDTHHVIIDAGILQSLWL